MRWLAFAIAMVAAVPRAHAGDAIRCDDLATADVVVDGLLDDWKQSQVLARVPHIDLRCSWDGKAIAIALDIKDDRVVRVRGGKGHEDHVDVTLSAGDKPVAIGVYPGNSIAKSKISAPGKVAVADSLQPKGFSIELRVPASAIPGFSTSTPSLAAKIVFHDSDAATGGSDTDRELSATIELGDRKDLLDDFLKTVRLRRGDLKLDVVAELDLDHRGKERLVAGGTVIGVLTDQFAFVTLPGEVRAVTLLPLGPRGQQIVSAIVRQTGNGGSRDLLMLWVVWTGQLQPLAQIEVRKQQGGNLLEATWKVAKGKHGPELVVEPRPAIGWTAETWNEQPADDAESIVVPWDPTKTGVAYALTGKELARRDLPARKQKR